MVECTWTWPRYLKMQDHWLRWGPPVYIPVAGYFRLGSASKKGKRSKPSAGDEETKTAHDGERGNLNELLTMFTGGVIQ